jgi:hypothetical protein
MGSVEVDYAEFKCVPIYTDSMVHDLRSQWRTSGVLTANGAPHQWRQLLSHSRPKVPPKRMSGLRARFDEGLVDLQVGWPLGHF